jgi:hypothetical protein
VKAYDDTLVVITADDRLVKLAVSTHPWETRSQHVPDVDGDGKGDVGMIFPGRYVAVARDASGNIGGAKTFHVLTTARIDGLAGARNTDGDDAYSEAEIAKSRTRGDKLTAVLFHQGGDGAPAAVGCQVLDAEGIRTFAREVGRELDYVLVDANLERDVP